MKQREKEKIYIFAIAATGIGISGSDRIFIEFARRWKNHMPIIIHVWQEGYEMCQKQHLQAKNISYSVSKMELWKKYGFIVNYFARIFESLKIACSIKLEDTSSTIVYSASEFWMDSFPCAILKLRFKKIKWVATWYQTAPNPIKGFSLGHRENTYKISALLYWLIQLPIKPLISRFADYVLVNNESERKQFSLLNKKKRTIVVIGAVPLVEIEKFKRRNGNIKKIFDAVFQGRFHPQKGVSELIDIWKNVVAQKPLAKLVMIGDGPLMDKVKLKIKKEKLENNITLLGYVFDGPQKYQIFAKSKLVVHPAFYDSGGMSAAEAMAFSLPCVGFNLMSYKSYYPYGMIKVPIGNQDAFANSIIQLLDNQKLRKEISSEGMAMIKRYWSWDTRAEEILSKII